MIKGFWEKRLDKMCESFYLVNEDKNVSYTFQIVEHHLKENENVPGTDITNDKLGILRALADALQAGGYIPKSAVDAELKATKYHLEDMRKLTLDYAELTKDV